jgi:hypothetical protein
MWGIEPWSRSLHSNVLSRLTLGELQSYANVPSILFATAVSVISPTHNELLRCSHWERRYLDGFRVVVGAVGGEADQVLPTTRRLDTAGGLEGAWIWSVTDCRRDAALWAGASGAASAVKPVSALKGGDDPHARRHGLSGFTRSVACSWVHVRGDQVCERISRRRAICSDYPRSLLVRRKRFG